MTADIIDSVADKPAIVLVPGAFDEASQWSAVVAALKNNDFSVAVADNPHETLEGDTGVLLDLLGRLDGPLVLVAHGYGGMLISNAACVSRDVQALVFVAALAPDKGETLTDLLGDAAPDDATARGAAGDPAWKLLPSWFVYGDADEHMPAALLSRLAARAGAVEAVVVAGGKHDLIASYPCEILRVIDMAVQATIAQVPNIVPD